MSSGLLTSAFDAVRPPRDSPSALRESPPASPSGAGSYGSAGSFALLPPVSGGLKLFSSPQPTPTSSCFGGGSLRGARPSRSPLPLPSPVRRFSPTPVAAAHSYAAGSVLSAADTPSCFSATLESFFPPPASEADTACAPDEVADDEIGALLSALTGFSESNTAALGRLHARLANAVDADEASSLLQQAEAAFQSFDCEVDRVLGCAVEAAVANAQDACSPGSLVAELRRSVAEARETQEGSWAWLESRVAQLRMKKRYLSS